MCLFGGRNVCKGCAVCTSMQCVACAGCVSTGVQVGYVICVGVCLEHVCFYQMCVVCGVGEW